MTGGNGGLYGGGGGGATYIGATAGTGAQGIIVITYTPVSVSGPTRIMRLFQGYRIKFVRGRIKII